MNSGAGVPPVDLKPTNPGTFIINITTANNLIAEWGLIAQSIAQQCKWRPQGQCLAACKGLAVCNLEGLTLVNAQGRPVAQAPPPADLL